MKAEVVQELIHEWKPSQGERHLAEKWTNGRAQELSAIQLQPSPVSMVNLRAYSAYGFVTFKLVA